jgi:hypothetical protein
MRVLIGLKDVSFKTRKFNHLIWAITLSLFFSSCNLSQLQFPIPSPTSIPTVEPTETATITPTVKLSLTPTPTITPTPEPTATPTDIPEPELPRELIDTSYGFLEEESALQKDEDGNWVLKDVNGRTFYRWDPQENEWIDEKPLYWECGKNPMLDLSPRPHLPTGLILREEKLLESSQVKARACLVEVDSYPDPNYPEHTLRGKIMFYDNQRNPHVYDFMSGGILDNGNVTKSATVERSLYQEVYRRQERDDLAQILEEHLDAGIETTRQVDVNYVTKLESGWIFLSGHTEKHRETYKKLERAIRYGKDFPEAPEDFFIYVIIFDIVPLPWEVVPRDR